MWLNITNFLWTYYFPNTFYTDITKLKIVFNNIIGLEIIEKKDIQSVLIFHIRTSFGETRQSYCRV